MATITIENVPEIIVKTYGTKVSYEVFLNYYLEDGFDIDFRELDKIEITSEIINSFNEAKKIQKSKLINLSKEYANY